MDSGFQKWYFSLEQINIAWGVCHVAIDLANAFFSTSVKSVHIYMGGITVHIGDFAPGLCYSSVCHSGDLDPTVWTFLQNITLMDGIMLITPDSQYVLSTLEGLFFTD